ncbi:MAG TPA: universal stress protein [Bryobacteraceae bacterium]|nr:universal stress protein [Bryobacteraceae bacterium]
MAWLSTILAPVAFSPRCRGATQYAETLASHFHTQLILLHVVPPPLGLFTALEAPAYSTATEVSQETLQQRKAELAQYLESPSCDIPLRTEVAFGEPAHEIVEAARQSHADLIVMATHGYGPFRRFLLGSVTAKVLHDAACPVWTGPHLEQAPHYRNIAFRRIMCAIDLAEASRGVLEWASRFAGEFGAPLDIVHVLPHTLIELGGLYFDPEWRGHAVEAVRERICRLEQETHTSGEMWIEFGDPPIAVSDLAANRKADLLVIGRGRHGGLGGRLRANAYAILRESPCPVVTI